LEALAGGKPAVLMGEGGLVGLCTPETWPTALRTNLGDHFEKKDFQTAKLETALRELLVQVPGDERTRWARQQVEQYFDARAIAQEVEKVYQWLISRS
jgi:hypothetical protein